MKIETMAVHAGYSPDPTTKSAAVPIYIGDAKSLATHPASTTHRQLDAAELAKAGVSEDMVRLSIGIEHIDDLQADLEQALAAV